MLTGLSAWAKLHHPRRGTVNNLLRTSGFSFGSLTKLLLCHLELGYLPKTVLFYRIFVFLNRVLEGQLQDLLQLPHFPASNYREKLIGPIVCVAIVPASPA